MLSRHSLVQLAPAHRHTLAHHNTRRFSGLLFASLLTAVCLTACKSKPAEQEPRVLNIYNWGEYIAPVALERFQKENNVKIVYDVYDSNETLLAKLQAGAEGYDLVFPSDYMVTIMIKNDILAPLDMSLLPNAKHIDPILLNQYFDPGNKYSLPYMYGTTGIGVRTDKTTEKIEGWMDLFKPAPGLQGKISMLNDMRDVLGAALKALGYSLNSTDPKQIEEAKQLLLAQKPHVKVYDSTSYKNNFESGEVAAGQAWNGDMASMYWKGNKNLKYIFPKEGGSIYCESFAIPKKAPHKELAHQFINFLMIPEIAAETTNVTYYATANKDALPFVRKELMTDSTIFPPEEVKPKLEFYRDLGEASKLYDAAFTELKTN